MGKITTTIYQIKTDFTKINIDVICNVTAAFVPSNDVQKVKQKYTENRRILRPIDNDSPLQSSFSRWQEKKL